MANDDASGAGGRGGGGGAAKKPDPLQPHPVQEQLQGVHFCVNSSPSWVEAMLLGFQHYVLSLGMNIIFPSVIVPEMGGGNTEKAKVIQTSLFLSGVSTLLQSYLGTRLPAVVVGSNAYTVPIMSIVYAQRYASYGPAERFFRTMRGIQGALIITAVFQTMLGSLGLWRNITRLLSPLSAIPLVTFSGLGLYYLGFPMLGKCLAFGLPALLIMVLISQYMVFLFATEKAIFDRYSVFFTVAIIWVFALILTASGAHDEETTNAQISCRTDHSGLITGIPWRYIPHPFQWGNPTFNAGEIFAMIAASLVSLIESTGVFIATARYGGATPVPSSVLNRGVAWLGVGTMLNGFCGTVSGTSISVENAGLIALTKVGSRRVVQISALFMIFFSLLGKVGIFFASIPLPLMAAIYCVCFAYVSSAGLSFLQFCNLNSFRTTFILGFSCFMGLSVPQYFREYQKGMLYSPIHTRARWFNDIVTVIFMSHATVAVMVAVFLDQTLSRKDEATRKDNGTNWWNRFKSYSSDIRSDEFYALPFRLNKFWPAV